MSDHVSRAANSGESESVAVDSLPAANLRTIGAIVVVPGNPVISGGDTLLKLLSDPLGGTSPGNNGVSIARVDQDAKIVLEEELVVGDHAGAGGAIVEGVGADRPLDIARNVESLLGRGAVEVVLGVVGVDARNLLSRTEEQLGAVDGVMRREESLSHALVEASTVEAGAVDPVGVDVVIAVVSLVDVETTREAIGIRGAARLDVGVQAWAHETVTISEGNPGIESGFRLSVRHRVTSTSSNKIDLRVLTSSVASNDLSGKSGDIDASIRLTKDEELVAGVARSLLEEGQQEVQVVSSSRIIIAVVVVRVLRVSVANADRAFEVDEAGNRGPTVARPSDRGGSRKRNMVR